MEHAPFGKHYGPPIDGWRRPRAARMRALGYRTIGANAYQALIAAGLEPRDFEPTDPGPADEEVVVVVGEEESLA